MRSATSVTILEQRSSGILLPLFSLPGGHGIGDMGPSARAFIDYLGQCGQQCWQILPLAPTSSAFGNSPYMSPSSLAGDPLFISLELLVEQGLLRQIDIDSFGFNEYSVEYGQVAAFKNRLLRRAWAIFQAGGDRRELDDFVVANPWVSGHGLFYALKGRFQGTPWFEWPEPIKQRQPGALAQAASDLADEIDYHVFEQYLFSNQWRQVHEYAREKGIQIIGDLPIYVALDSVDVWCNQPVFQLDSEHGQPTHIAGVPPDYFSADGQRWGNPLYRWDDPAPRVRESLLAWWEERLRMNFALADVVRIDHFRGFEAYWAVPEAEETAVNGAWQPGPGRDFFEEMTRRLGPMAIIAEDLGEITPEVEQLRRDLGYPGMKILLFAFDGQPDNSFLPYNCERHSVLYTGTHDNDTAVGWYLSPAVDPASKRQAKRFANRTDDEAGSFHRELIHLALGSPSNLVVLPMQDVLGFGNDCRMNTPGTVTDNWRWRCAQRFFSDEIAAWLHDQIRLFGRHPRPQPTEPSSHEHPDLQRQSSQERQHRAPAGAG